MRLRVLDRVAQQVAHGKGHALAVERHGKIVRQGGGVEVDGQLAAAQNADVLDLL